MSKKVWTGAVSTDVTVDGNYQGGAKPITGDEVYLNDQAQRDMASGLSDAYWINLTLSVIVEKTWTRKVGAAGTPWILGGIDRLVFQGDQRTANSYFKVDAGAGTGSDTLALCVCDTRSTRESVLNIEGTINRLVSLNGSVAVLTGSVVDTRITCNGGSIIIPTGVTLTGAEASCLNGTFSCESTIPVVSVNGGHFILDGGADISSYLEVNDGTFSWQGEGTSGDHSSIALAECFGGLFRTVLERQYRTLTEMNMYKTASVDLTAGGLLMTLPTNGIGIFGDNAPKLPRGARFSPAI